MTQRPAAAPAAARQSSRPRRRPPLEASALTGAPQGTRARRGSAPRRFGERSGRAAAQIAAAASNDPSAFARSRTSRRPCSRSGRCVTRCRRRVGDRRRRRATPRPRPGRPPDRRSTRPSSFVRGSIGSRRTRSAARSPRPACRPTATRSGSPPTGSSRSDVPRAASMRVTRPVDRVRDPERTRAPAAIALGPLPTRTACTTRRDVRIDERDRPLSWSTIHPAAADDRERARATADRDRLHGATFRRSIRETVAVASRARADRCRRRSPSARPVSVPATGRGRPRRGRRRCPHRAEATARRAPRVRRYRDHDHDHRRDADGRRGAPPRSRVAAASVLFSRCRKPRRAAGRHERRLRAPRARDRGSGSRARAAAAGRSARSPARRRASPRLAVAAQRVGLAAGCGTAQASVARADARAADARRRAPRARRAAAREGRARARSRSGPSSRPAAARPGGRPRCARPPRARPRPAPARARAPVLAQQPPPRFDSPARPARGPPPPTARTGLRPAARGRPSAAYPSGRVAIGSSPLRASVLRSCETWTLSALSAVGGGASPHSSSISRVA